MTINSFLSLANSFVGVTEKGGDNKGPEVEMFQKALDGVARGEAWCASFVCYCVKAMNVPSPIFLSEHCMTMWNKTPNEHKFTFKTGKPAPGDIVIWQYYKDGKPTASGHTGIVESVSPQSLITIEGNTGPSNSEVVREGDGVYKKVRSVRGSPKMKIVGFIRPF